MSEEALPLFPWASRKIHLYLSLFDRSDNLSLPCRALQLFPRFLLLLIKKEIPSLNNPPSFLRVDDNHYNAPEK